MKKFHKLLAALLCLCMVLSLLPVTARAEEAPLATENEIVIYYTNDVHTYIDKDLGYDNIADLKTQTETQAAGVLLVDAGDHIQGTAYGSMDNGATIIELMNAANYDLATLGNHEFDYGMDGCMNVIDWAEFPYVSCNFYHEDPANPSAGGYVDNGWEIRDTVLEPFEMYDVAGVKIAIIGVTTPESFTKSTPAYFQDENGNYIYGIAGGEDGQALYDYVQFAINAAQLAEADVVIALAHLGDDPASQPWTSEELIANTTGLDAVIDGHSHSTVERKEVADEGGCTVILTQTGEYFDAIGRMSIDTETLAVTTSLITEYEGSDADVKAIQDAWIAEVDAQLDVVIGSSEVDLLISDENGRQIRSREMNIGDFCADALYYLFDDMGLDVDVAIMNGGGIRANAEAGEITYKTCKTVHTFGNVACLQTITGQQLLDALEWGAKDAGSGENGGFLQVSGITYEIHTYIESTVQKDDKNVWIGGPTGEYRVKNVKILQDGEYVDLDLDAKYNLAGYNYTLRDLGDGFAMFDGAVNVLDYVKMDYLVLADYVQSFPVDEETGLPTITAENSPYGDIYGDGRIIIVNEPDQEIIAGFTDVPADAWYAEAVAWAVEKDITKGTTDTTFEPFSTVERCQVVTMLWRMAGKPAVEAENPFIDVDEHDYFYDAVLWAVKNGITKGTTDITFSPHDPVERCQVVTFLWRYFGKPTVEAENPFTDVDKDEDYYYDAVLWAVKNNITQGTTNTTFGSIDSCERAALVTFLYRCRDMEPVQPEEPETRTVWYVDTYTEGYEDYTYSLDYIFGDNGMPTEVVSYASDSENGNQELLRAPITVDANGNILTETYNLYDTEYTFTYTYNEDNSIATERFSYEILYYPDEPIQVTQQVEYTYNQDGVLTEYLSLEEFWGMFSAAKEVYTLDADGNITRVDSYILEVDEEGNIVPDGQVSHDRYTVYTLDENGRWTGYETRNGSDDGLLYTATYSYEETADGMVVTEEIDPYRLSYNYTNVYTYDTHGNLLSWAEYTDGELDWTTTYTWVAAEIPVA